jgi:beta-glucosidase
MENRTYRYFKGEPLFPFGYGLSYTTFSYSKFRVDKAYTSGDTVKISVKIKNTGKKAGEEVVEVYLSNLTASVPVAIRSLEGFKRVHLLPGEVKTISLSIAPDAFSVIDQNDKQVIEPGKFLISAGGHQPQKRNTDAESGIVKKIVSIL